MIGIPGLGTLFSFASIMMLGVPSPSRLPCAEFSTLPSTVWLVGRDAAGTADPSGEFEVVVRDCWQTPMANAVFIADFSACTDARISSNQEPGVTTHCSQRSLTALTGSDGSVRIRVVGSAEHAAVPSTGAQLRLYADGVFLRNVRFAAFDHDGGGVGPTDLALWVGDYFSGLHPARSDYDGDAVVGAPDLSEWLEVYFAAGSIRGGSAPTCPP